MIRTCQLHPSSSSSSSSTKVSPNLQQQRELSFNNGGLQSSSTSSTSCSSSQSFSVIKEALPSTKQQKGGMNFGKKPKLTFLHKSNEMILRDDKNRVCAVIVGPKLSEKSSRSSNDPRQYKVYGVTPMYPGQGNTRGLEQAPESNSMRVLQETETNHTNNNNTKLTFYEWAAIQGKRVRSRLLITSRMTFRLELTPDPTNPTRAKCFTMKTYYHQGSGSSSFLPTRRGCKNQLSMLLQDRINKDSTIVPLDHTLIAKISSSMPGVENESTVSPDMNPCLCVFFLACAEELIAYIHH